MSAWQSPRERALFDAKDRGVPALYASTAIDAAFYRLTEPDRVMLDAGAAEFARALPPGTTKAYARNLAGVVWRAMLEAAR